MNNNEIKNLLKGKAPQGYSFNQFVLFDYPYKQITKIAKVKRIPDDHLNNLYLIILRAVQNGMTNKEKLFDFLGVSAQDYFIKNEFLFLIDQGFLEETYESYSLTELGEAYTKNEITIWIEDTIDYNFLIDTLTGNILSLNKVKDIGKNVTGKSLTPDPYIFNHTQKHLQEQQEQIQELFHNDYQGKTLLLDFKDDQYLGKLVWRPLILAEYTSNNYEDAPHYIVRSVDGIYQDYELSEEFNTRLMRHIPFLFA